MKSEKFMKLLKKKWDFLFNHKTICGKEWVRESMTEKYGTDWLDQCCVSLSNPSVREDLKETLKL